MSSLRSLRALLHRGGGTTPYKSLTKWRFYIVCCMVCRSYASFQVFHGCICTQYVVLNLYRLGEIICLTPSEIYMYTFTAPKCSTQSAKKKKTKIALEDDNSLDRPNPNQIYFLMEGNQSFIKYVSLCLTFCQY